MNDRPEYPVQTVLEWLRYADGDLRVAERELRSRAPVYHTICFLCQGAAEKYLKAYLIAQGWQLAKTHDLVALLALCADHDSELGSLTSEGAVLNEYIIAGRYPGDIAFEQIGKDEAREALHAVQRISARVKHLLGKM